MYKIGYKLDAYKMGKSNEENLKQKTLFSLLSPLIYPLAPCTCVSTPLGASTWNNPRYFVVCPSSASSLALLTQVQHALVCAYKTNRLAFLSPPDLRQSHPKGAPCGTYLSLCGSCTLYHSVSSGTGGPYLTHTLGMLVFKDLLGSAIG